MSYTPKGTLVDGGFTFAELMRSRAEAPAVPILRETSPPRLGPVRNLDSVVEAVSESYSYSVEELRSVRRQAPLARARMVGYYVARELSGYSYPVIARAFGRLDHTTVIHGVRRVQADVAMLAEADQLLTYLRTAS
jgi:chromosomal replication initiation ATPase DnaA